MFARWPIGLSSEFFGGYIVLVLIVPLIRAVMARLLFHTLLLQGWVTVFRGTESVLLRVFGFFEQVERAYIKQRKNTAKGMSAWLMF